MNCNEFERMIPRYFHNELREKELEQFIEHVMNCDICKEEMTIQYLITEGVQRLEDGQTLDVEKELGQKLKHSQKHIVRVRVIKDLIEGLIVVGLLCAIAIVIWYLVR